MRNTLSIAAGFGLFTLLAGCSGSAVTDGPAAPGAGSAGTTPSAGSGGMTSSGGSASTAGSGGSTASAGAGGMTPTAGSGGTSGECTTGETKTVDCNTCQCASAEWVCTRLACNVQCGGFVGSTCSANQYCAYMPGELCGAADASSTCKSRPTACDDIYAPVCGCDRKTYPSSCEANAQGQGVYSSGACPATTN